MFSDLRLTVEKYLKPGDNLHLLNYLKTRLINYNVHNYVAISFIKKKNQMCFNRACSS